MLALPAGCGLGTIVGDSRDVIAMRDVMLVGDIGNSSMVVKNASAVVQSLGLDSGFADSVMASVNQTYGDSAVMRSQELLEQTSDMVNIDRLLEITEDNVFAFESTRTMSSILSSPLIARRVANGEADGYSMYMGIWDINLDSEFDDGDSWLIDDHVDAVVGNVIENTYIPGRVLKYASVKFGNGGNNRRLSTDEKMLVSANMRLIEDLMISGEDPTVV